MHVNDDDVLDLDTPVDDEVGEEGQPIAEDEPEEDILEIEGEEPADDDNATIRRMREHLNRLEQENRSLKATAPKLEVGPRPKAEDFDYDDDAFSEAIIKWNDQKRKVDEQAAVADEPQAKVVQQFETSRAEYQREKAQIRIPDFDALEARVEAVLSIPQQQTLMMSAKNKASVVAALGRYPNRLDALAKIENPFALAIAIADLERNIKVKPRMKGAEPEDKMRGSAPLAITEKQKEIDKLEKKMMQGGDVTAIRSRLKELRG